MKLGGSERRVHDLVIMSMLSLNVGATMVMLRRKRGNLYVQEYSVKGYRLLNWHDAQEKRQPPGMMRAITRTSNGVYLPIACKRMQMCSIITICAALPTQTFTGMKLYPLSRLESIKFMTSRSQMEQISSLKM